MEQRRVTPLTTAGCFAAIMLVFALLSTYVPIFSFIGYFIMPIPMVIIFMKYGLRQALLLGVTVGFLMGLFIDPVTALVQFLSFGAVGLTLGAGFRYEWSAVRLLGTVTAALVAVFVVITLLSYVVLDVNLFTQMNDFFTQFMDNMMAQYQQQGMSDVNWPKRGPSSTRSGRCCRLCCLCSSAWGQPSSPMRTSRFHRSSCVGSASRLRLFYLSVIGKSPAV